MQKFLHDAAKIIFFRNTRLLSTDSTKAKEVATGSGCALHLKKHFSKCRSKSFCNFIMTQSLTISTLKKGMTKWGKNSKIAWWLTVDGVAHAA